MLGAVGKESSRNRGKFQLLIFMEFDRNSGKDSRHSKRTIVTKELLRFLKGAIDFLLKLTESIRSD